jgi:hypothetical protein
MSGTSSPARIATKNAGGTATKLNLSKQSERAMGGQI